MREPFVSVCWCGLWGGGALIFPLSNRNKVKELERAERWLISKVLFLLSGEVSSPQLEAASTWRHKIQASASRPASATATPCSEVSDGLICRGEVSLSHPAEVRSAYQNYWTPMQNL